MIRTHRRGTSSAEDQAAVDRYLRCVSKLSRCCATPTAAQRASAAGLAGDPYRGEALIGHRVAGWLLYCQSARASGRQLLVGGERQGQANLPLDIETGSCACHAAT
jgi:hypothetical protein